MPPPVPSLPFELLARIFQEATCHDGHDETRLSSQHYSSPVTLSAVCKQWRDVAVNSRSLWSHLDLLLGAAEIEASYPPSELWTSRLQGCPLQIHIRQRIFPFGYYSQPDKSGDTHHSNQNRPRDDLFIPKVGDRDVVLEGVARLVDFLRPLIPHVESLEIVASKGLRQLLPHVAKLIADAADGLDLRNLRIIYTDAWRFVRLEPQTSTEVLRSAFSSLTKLDLRIAWTSWEHLTRLPNLLELRLEKPCLSGKWQITQDEFTIILASCPKLRSLMLSNIEITPYTTPTKPETVVLPELRILSIRTLAWSPREMELAISMITPGPHPLHMSVDLSELCGRSSLQALRSFIARANVTVLDVRSAGDKTRFAFELGRLPNVHTLALHDFYLSDSLNTYLNEHIDTKQVDRSNYLWPRLRTLHLVSCGLEKQYFQRLLSLHDIETLYLHRCFDDCLPEIREAHDLSAPEGGSKALMMDHMPNVVVLNPKERDGTSDWLFVGSPL